MDLHEIVKGTSKLREKRKLIGRGPGSGLGKSAGRGMKGFRSRSGSSLPTWYEGGATPTYRRFPKRGFNNKRFADIVEEVNVGALKRFKAGAEIGPLELKAAGLIHGKGRIKLLGQGAIDKGVTVRVHAVSPSAKSKVEAAGGKVAILEK